MMEQNSDRLYWIIGAILVGTALIMIAYKYFPSLFNTGIKAKFDQMFGQIDDAFKQKDYDYGSKKKIK